MALVGPQVFSDWSTECGVRRGEVGDEQRPDLEECSIPYGVSWALFLRPGGSL